jgi:hypothetical protein
MNFATRSSEMWLASAEVIAHRTQRMAQMRSNPSSVDQHELQRMVGEKVEAASDSLQAMGAVVSSAYQDAFFAGTNQAMRNFTAMMSGKRLSPGPVSGSAADGARMLAQLADAGMAPFHRRAKSNAKRLRKR